MSEDNTDCLGDILAAALFNVDMKNAAKSLAEAQDHLSRASMNNGGRLDSTAVAIANSWAEIEAIVYRLEGKLK